MSADENGSDLLEVPDLQPVAKAILQLLETQDFDMKTFAETIQTDPAIAAQLLRMASSPLYGASQKFTDLTHAVVFLGLRTAVTVGLGLALFDGIKQGHGSLDERWCCRRLLTNAAGARELARQTKTCPTDQAFLTGLTQDFGLMLLIQQRPLRYRKVLSAFRADPRPLADWERELLEMDHGAVSAAIADYWNLPEESRRAIELHHDEPDNGADDALAEIIRGAEALSDLLLGVSVVNYKVVLHRLNRLIAADDSELESLIDTVESNARQLADVLHVPWEHSVNGRAVLQQIRHSLE